MEQSCPKYVTRNTQKLQQSAPVTTLLHNEGITGLLTALALTEQINIVQPTCQLILISLLTPLPHTYFQYPSLPIYSRLSIEQYCWDQRKVSI